MVLVTFIVNGVERCVHLKLEGHGPAGSIKYRTATAILGELERSGRLLVGMTVIESTSGNLGVALAMISRARGYRFVAVIDPKTPSSKRARMLAHGAEVECVTDVDDHGGYLLSRLASVREHVASSNRYVWTNQYEAAANPDAHYRETGPEILQQLRGRVDAVLVAVSTGGTLAGISRYFREHSPATLVVGVDVCGSVVFGDVPAPRRLTGIGSSRPSAFLTAATYDKSILVTDQEAVSFCWALADGTGIRVGGSSGAVLAACVKLLSGHPELGRVVCLCPDGGEGYAETVYNEAWLREQHLEHTRSRSTSLDGVCGDPLRGALVKAPGGDPPTGVGICC